MWELKKGIYGCRRCSILNYCQTLFETYVQSEADKIIIRKIKVECNDKDSIAFSPVLKKQKRRF